MDYHLEPARYETIQMTKLMARYELRMYCDWIGQLEAGLAASVTADTGNTNLIDVEHLRKALCKESEGGFYHGNAAATENEAADEQRESISQQWAELIDIILRQTAWSEVSTSGTSRNVSLVKVQGEMTYSAKIQDGDKPGISVSTNVVGAKIMGIVAVTLGVNGQTAYDAEKLGDLINNSNMYEIVEKMRTHGCFLEQNSGFALNPKVQDQSPDSSNTDLRHLLNKDDELVFPVNLKSVVGHKDGEGDDLDVDNGMELEINIVFKQKSDPAGLGHHDDVIAPNTSGTSEVPDSSNVV